jgi:hypothetical protein
MQINFRGQYNQALFYKAVRLANQSRKNRQRLMVFMFIISIAALGVLIFRSIEAGGLQENPIFIAAALFLAVYTGFYLFQPYFAARKLWGNPGVRRELKGLVTNRGITYLLPEGENEIPWERISRLRKVTGLVTLVRRDGLLLIFPQEFFKNSADWRKFEVLAASKVSSLLESKRGN